MPKNTSQRIIDARTTRSGVVFAGGTGGGSGGVTDHGALTGLADDDHGQYHNDARGDARYVPLSRTVSTTTPLNGGGALSSNLTIAIDTGSNYQYLGTGSGTTAAWQNVSGLAGSGLAHSAGALSVGVATTLQSGAGAGLSAESDAIRLTASYNPGAASAVLATDSSGYVTVVKLRTQTIDTASGDLAVNPAGVVDFYKGIQADNYASQVTGWRVTYDGQADFRYLYVDEMHAKSFIADLEQALAGGQIISKSVAMVGQDFTAPAAGGTGTLYVRDLPSAPDMAVFQTGDVVLLRTFTRSGGSLTIANCWGVVSDYTDGNGTNFAEGYQSYTFTRSSGGNAGTMSAGATVPVDSLALDYGTTGNGFYEVNAIDGAYGANSPYAQVVTWSTHPATGQTVRTRMGNLYGVTSQSGEYGLWAGSGTSNDSSYLRVSSYAVRLNNVPLTLYNSGTQTVNISSTGTDIWVGPSSSDKRLTWDGSNLTIKGQATIKGGAAVTTSGAGLYLGSDKMGYYNGTDWKTSIDSSGNFTFLGAGSNNYLKWVAASDILQGVASNVERWRLEPSGMTFYESTNGSGTAALTWRSNAAAEKSRIGYASSTDQMFWNLSVPMTISGTIYGGTFAGNTGFGTASPTLPIHAYGTYGNPATTGTTPNGIAAFSSNDTYSSLYVGNSSTSPYNMWLQAQGRNALGTNYAIVLNPNGGNVGIGTLTPGALIDTPDADNAARFGPAIVGYTAFSDTATFAHRDNTSSSTYSVAQNSSGKTVVNSASGQTIDFRIANTNVMNIAGTYIEFVQGAISDKYIEFGGTPYESTDGPGGVFGKIRIFLRDAGTGKYELRWVSKNTANTATRGGVIFDTSEGADIP